MQAPHGSDPMPVDARDRQVRQSFASRSAKADAVARSIPGDAPMMTTTLCGQRSTVDWATEDGRAVTLTVTAMIGSLQDTSVSGARGGIVDAALCAGR